jgi:hypothetical protein
MLRRPEEYCRTTGRVELEQTDFMGPYPKTVGELVGDDLQALVGFACEDHGGEFAAEYFRGHGINLP